MLATTSVRVLIFAMFAVTWSSTSFDGDKSEGSNKDGKGAAMIAIRFFLVVVFRLRGVAVSASVTSLAQALAQVFALSRTVHSHLADSVEFRESGVGFQNTAGEVF